MRNDVKICKMMYLEHKIKQNDFFYILSLETLMINVVKYK